MTIDQVVVAVLIQCALLATVVGLVVRGRWRLSWFFAAYVPIALTGNALVTWWPAVFFVPSFWMAKQAIYDVLKVGIAVELCWRTFRVFPGASTAVRYAIVLVALLTLLALVFGSVDLADYLGRSGQLHPRIANGVIWLFAVTLILAAWYHVPLHPFHRAILGSFGVYLTVFGALLRLEAINGWAAQAYLNAIDPAAYLLLSVYWVHLAWRPETALTRSYVETVRKLELRATSCG